MTSMFRDATSFNQDVSTWNVSSVTGMWHMFYNATSFNNGGIALTWTEGTGTAAVTSMENMFNGATSFNQDVSTWDVSSVTSMTYMFNGATSFNNGGTALTWGTGTVAVTNMTDMFNEATSFNQDVGSWDVSSVTIMRGMFFGATSFNQNISTWDVSSVDTTWDMFKNATAFNNGGNALTWIVGTGTFNLKDMEGMFFNATSFNQDISTWNMGSALYMIDMFNGATSFNQDIGSWNTTTVELMQGMFNGSTSFNQDISGWNVSSVTTMTNMLNGATVFNQALNSWSVPLIPSEPTTFWVGTLSETNGKLSPWDEVVLVVTLGVNLIFTLSTSQASVNGSGGTWSLANNTSGSSINTSGLVTSGTIPDTLQVVYTVGGDVGTSSDFSIIARPKAITTRFRPPTSSTDTILTYMMIIFLIVFFIIAVVYIFYPRS